MAWIQTRAPALSHSSAAADSSTWPSLPGVAPSPTANTTHLLVACSCHGWPTVNCSRHRFGTTLPLFGPKTSTSSVPSKASSPVFPAQISALQALVKVWQATSPVFGAKSRALQTRFDHHSCSWKMYQRSESEEPQTLSEIWPVSGMTVGEDCGIIGQCDCLDRRRADEEQERYDLYRESFR